MLKLFRFCAVGAARLGEAAGDEAADDEDDSDADEEDVIDDVSATDADGIALETMVVSGTGNVMLCTGNP